MQFCNFSDMACQCRLICKSVYIWEICNISKRTSNNNSGDVLFGHKRKGSLTSTIRVGVVAGSSQEHHLTHFVRLEEIGAMIGTPIAFGLTMIVCFTLFYYYWRIRQLRARLLSVQAAPVLEDIPVSCLSISIYHSSDTVFLQLQWKVETWSRAAYYNTPSK